MERSIFRKKSIEQISSPEELNDYLHVTSPALWVVLAAVILILAGIIVWSWSTTLESYVDTTVQVSGGTLTFAVGGDGEIQNAEAGMEVRVGDVTVPILSVGETQDGGRFAVAEIDLPDGIYSARVGKKGVKIIEMLFN